ncbi:hypothetical protein HMPREF9148_02027 [Prevotella sp. F0091]|nr:hypothetical protein HMPREF9148_02027 [Prevotella sp. F0091]
MLVKTGYIEDKVTELTSGRVNKLLARTGYIEDIVTGGGGKEYCRG